MKLVNASWIYRILSQVAMVEITGRSAGTVDTPYIRPWNSQFQFSHLTGRFYTWLPLNKSMWALWIQDRVNKAAQGSPVYWPPAIVLYFTLELVILIAVRRQRSRFYTWLPLNKSLWALWIQDMVNKAAQGSPVCWPPAIVLYFTLELVILITVRRQRSRCNTWLPLTNHCKHCEFKTG